MSSNPGKKEKTAPEGLKIYLAFFSHEYQNMYSYYLCKCFPAGSLFVPRILPRIRKKLAKRLHNPSQRRKSLETKMIHLKDL